MQVSKLQVLSTRFAKRVTTVIKRVTFLLNSRTWLKTVWINGLRTKEQMLKIFRKTSLYELKSKA